MALRFQLLTRIVHQAMQTGLALIEHRPKFRPHSRIPKLSDVIGNTRDCLVVRVRGKVKRDLIRVVDDAPGVHFDSRDLPPASAGIDFPN